MAENNHDHDEADLNSSKNIMEEVKKISLKPKYSFKDKYDFWDTQPVLKINEVTHDNEAIEPNKPVEEIRQEPYSLPETFYWDDISLEKDDELSELYTLLNENYVEDDDNMFRFDYSPEFLKWALMPPGWRPEWFAGIRVKSNKKLVGFISGVPSTVSVYNKLVKMVEINFLCVHKKLRSKRVAPVLIREITRRVNRQGIFQAVYTGGVLIPKPVATCMYWHRSLNPKKLIECHFSQLSSKMTMKRTLKLYKLPDAPQNSGFRQLTKADCPAAHQLLLNYLSQFHLHPQFETLEDFEHWFMPRKDVINTFVIEDSDGKITDMCSFYSLPSSVIDNAHHTKLHAAYSFYNVCKTDKDHITGNGGDDDTKNANSWNNLMKDALIQAKNLGFDVFNALDVMHNKLFMKELKFGPGDGQLHYYLYNWRCSEMNSSDVALVLQ